MHLSRRPNGLSVSLPVCLSLVVLFLIPQPLHARSVYTTVTAYFLTLDSLLDAMADSVVTFRTVDETSNFLLKQTQTWPEIGYIIRTSAQGKIVNKVTGGKIAPPYNRYVGNQGWHKTTESSKKPYYSVIVDKEALYLFWCKPVLVYSKYGSRFNGTVTAKINLGECFETLARLHDISFQIFFDGNTFFTSIADSSDAGHLIEQRLAIYGIRGLLIRYPEARYKPAVAATQSPVVSAPAVVVNRKEMATKSAVVSQGVHKASTKTTCVVPSIRRRVAFIIVALMCVVILAVCVVVMKNVVEKRQKFLEAIERGDV